MAGPVRVKAAAAREDPGDVVQAVARQAAGAGVALAVARAAGVPADRTRG